MAPEPLVTDMRPVLIRAAATQVLRVVFFPFFNGDARIRVFPADKNRAL
jgi:hypothetical protein